MGLTLGIIGTALAGLGGVFGGGNSVASAAFNAEAEIMKGDYETYITLNRQIVDNAKSISAVTAALPYAMELSQLKAERYVDNKVAQIEKELAVSGLMIQRQLDQKVNGVIGL